MVQKSELASEEDRLNWEDSVLLSSKLGSSAVPFNLFAMEHIMKI